MKYFAYGSNMDSDRMKERRIRFSKREHASIVGWKLVFNKLSSRNLEEGYANIEQDINEIVEGILYEIPDSDLKILDKYEGYPTHYFREQIKVKLDNKDELLASTYIANFDKTKKDLKPTSEYINHLLKGCDLLSNTYCQKIKMVKTL